MHIETSQPEARTLELPIIHIIAAYFHYWLITWIFSQLITSNDLSKCLFFQKSKNIWFTGTEHEEGLQIFIFARKET